MIHHPIEPFFKNDSNILILGSFPSVKSRESMFYYAHPQNRFWKVISAVFDEPVPITADDKRMLLSKTGIALWDIVKSCDISGSSDSSIINVIPNDITRILEESDIKHIYTNGKASYKLYQKYIKNSAGLSAVYLPSTSPANAAWSLERLISSWQIIRN